MSLKNIILLIFIVGIGFIVKLIYHGYQARQIVGPNSFVEIDNLGKYVVYEKKREDIKIDDSFKIINTQNGKAINPCLLLSGSLCTVEKYDILRKQFILIFGSKKQGDYKKYMYTVISQNLVKQSK